MSTERQASRHLRFYPRLVGIWCPLATVLFAFAFASLENFLTNVAIGLVISIVAASFCFWGVVGTETVIKGARRRRRRASGANDPVWSPSHLWRFSLAMLWMPAALYLGFGVTRLLAPLLGIQLSVPDLSSYREGLVLGLVVCALIFFLESRKDAKQAQQQARLQLKEAENARLKAQLAALTAQMNPHLLFNALNTIASLSTSDPEVAEEMTVQLSELLRGALAASKRETHPLCTELALCGAYLEVERARFGERLRSQVEIDPQLDVEGIEVPVLLLQPLVENAVKYAIAPRAEGGQLRLSVRGVGRKVEIVIADDGPGFGKSRAQPGTGTGIENVRARLALRYGEDASLTLESAAEGGAQVTMLIPSNAHQGSVG